MSRLRVIPLFWQPLLSRIKRFSYIVADLSLIATLFGFLARWTFVCEYMCHFRVQYTAVLGCGVILAIAERRSGKAALYLSSAALNFIVILPLYLEPTRNPTSDAATDRVRLLSVNVHSANEEYGKLIEYVRESNADIVVLVEVTREWVRALQPLGEEYPASVAVDVDTDYGVLALSRSAFLGSETMRVVGRGAVQVQIDVNGHPLNVVGAHTWAPTTRDSLQARNRQFELLAALARSSNGAFVLTGDLNTTSWSPGFSRLLQHSRLRDSRLGFGIQATWPTWCKMVQIPIDHCLVSKSVSVCNRTVGRFVGSDHLPVLVDLTIHDDVPEQLTPASHLSRFSTER